MRRAVAASGDVIYDWDLESDAIAWSGNAKEVFRLDNLEAIATGEGFRKRIDGRDPVLLGSGDSDGARFEAEYRLRRGDGGICWVQDRGTMVPGPGGRPTRLIGTLREITGRRLREAQLEHIASHDDMTGYLNRARLREAIDEAIADGLSGRGPSLFLAAGIDSLYEVGETLGYRAADAVIVEVGRRLAGMLHDGDAIGRISGHGYGLLLRDNGEHDMAARSRDLRETVRGTLIDTGAGRMPVTVSLGGVVVPKWARTGSDAMARAEEGLERAEHGGGDRLVAFAPNEASSARRRRSRDLVQRIVEAIEQNRLRLAFQPIVTATTGQVNHYECLLRLVGDNGEVVPAYRFMPVAERLGLVRMIDRRVLDLVVEEVTAWPELRLAVNVSGCTLADSSWHRALGEHFARRPDLASRLTVEITETAALRDHELLTRFVANLREFGCHVALDDFGAGHSTFRRLKGLAVDVIKIDGAFVRGLAGHRDNQLFVRTLLDLAKGFGLATVAECVENAVDAEYLAEHGVDYLQGYWIGTPAFERSWTGRPAAQGTGPSGGLAPQEELIVRIVHDMSA